MAKLFLNQKLVLEEVTQYYEDLHRETADVDLKYSVADLGTLSDEDSELIESYITYTDAVVALRKMKNRSPGSDGFSVEYFKFVFVDIGHILVYNLYRCCSGFTKDEEQKSWFGWIFG